MEYARIKSEGNFMVMKGGKSYTVADIESLPEGQRAELIDGELFMMASPTLTHQKLLGELYLQIRLYVKEKKGTCHVIPAPFAVYIKNDSHNYVEPDISVICDPNKIEEKGCLGAPDWIIEIVSPSSEKMDYERKRVLYQEAGVREYWIVDPQQRTVTVYAPEQDNEARKYSFSEQIKAGIYEDLYLDLTEYALR